MPSACASALIAIITSRAEVLSRPDVTSSKNKIRGKVTILHAAVTRLFWPPLIPLCTGVPMICSAHPASPIALMTRSTRARTSFAGSKGRCRRSAKAMDSRTVSTPRSASSCSTKDEIMCILRAVSARPLSVVDPPASACFLHDITSSNVLFPAPDGP
jgi:hypothetical protein